MRPFKQALKPTFSVGCSVAHWQVHFLSGALALAVNGFIYLIG
jgi:hypothetical protein